MLNGRKLGRWTDVDAVFASKPTSTKEKGHDHNGLVRRDKQNMSWVTTTVESAHRYKSVSDFEKKKSFIIQ
jgi:hypothetical protein